MDIVSEVMFLRKHNYSLRKQLDDSKNKQLMMLADFKKELNKYRLTVNKKEKGRTLNNNTKKNIILK